MRKYEEGTVAESTDTQELAEGASVETAGDAGEHVSETQAIWRRRYAVG